MGEGRGMGRRAITPPSSSISRLGFRIYILYLIVLLIFLSSIVQIRFLWQKMTSCGIHQSQPTCSYARKQSDKGLVLQQNGYLLMLSTVAGHTVLIQLRSDYTGKIPNQYNSEFWIRMLLPFIMCSRLVGRSSSANSPSTGNSIVSCVCVWEHVMNLMCNSQESDLLACSASV